MFKNQIYMLLNATYTAHVYAVSVLQSTLQKLAAIDAADDDPDQQIPGAEEGDDAVETVVGGISLRVCLLDHLLWLLLLNYHHISWKGGGADMSGVRREQDKHMIMAEEGKKVGWTTNMYCMSWNGHSQTYIQGGFSIPCTLGHAMEYMGSQTTECNSTLCASLAV